MAWSSQSMITANIRVIPSHKGSRRFLKRFHQKLLLNHNTIRASSSSNAEDDCNVEECAPDKEIGKVSMEWLAGEKTKVVGTYPPRKKGWTGYVEKDTAGQTNIYSVEPVVYVAESAISSGTAGISSDGAENTAAIVAGVALISIAAASTVLLQVSKNPPPPVQTLEYSGPSLSYYINKFKPVEIVESPSVTTEEPANSSVIPQLDISAPEVSEIPSEGINQEEASTPISNAADVS